MFATALVNFFTTALVGFLATVPVDFFIIARVGFLVTAIAFLGSFAIFLAGFFSVTTTRECFFTTVFNRVLDVFFISFFVFPLIFSARCFTSLAGEIPLLVFAFVFILAKILACI
ncbi:MAG: hypothetical protein V3S58_03985, partial [Nitrosomonadaceae bacterium]